MRHIIIVTLIILTQNIIAKEVSFATLEWPPYIGSKLKNNGIIGEILVKAFKSQGHKVSFTFLPWTRAIHESKKGKLDGYMPIYESKQRRNESFLSHAIVTGPLVLMKLKDHNKNYKTQRDLIHYSLGLVRGYKNTKEIDENNLINKSYSGNDLSNLKKLLKGRVDFIVIDKYVAGYLIKTHLNRFKNKFEVISPALEHKELMAAFPKESIYSKNLNSILNKGLSEIKNEIPNIIRRNLTN